jgi:hypothetical protein
MVVGPFAVPDTVMLVAVVFTLKPGSLFTTEPSVAGVEASVVRAAMGALEAIFMKTLSRVWQQEFPPYMPGTI